jgi:hypothetical protein
MKGLMPAALAILVVVGFLSLIGYLTATGADATQERQTLINGVLLALGYFLGSSAGSEKKTELMAENPGKNPPPEVNP